MEMRSALSRAGLVKEYEQHLRSSCGVTPETSALFIWHVSRFLSARYKKRQVDLTSLQPREVIKYISDLAPHYMPNTRKSAVTALRSFLRWLQMSGGCDQRVVEAVPTVSSRKWSELPRNISESDLRALLQSFDRTTAVGKRGYAVAICMARLGLRIGELARITLDDVDWRLGTLRLPTRKCRRGNVLPLPKEVGAALIDYLRKGRPHVVSRQVFLSYRPVGAPATRDTLRQDIYRAFVRARLNTNSKGTHVLRHTAATRLIQRGVTIKEIADILGHRSIDTTGIYAKVALPQLKEVASQWPEAKV